MKLFCGNLHWDLTTDDLKAAFSEHGQVGDVCIVQHMGRSKGYGFIEMPSEDDARRAMLAMDGKDLLGRPLRVNRAFGRKASTSKENS